MPTFPSSQTQETTRPTIPACRPTYGAKQQYALEEDQSPTLSKEDKTFIQEVIGVFLYYAIAVDCTMLAALGSLATQQPAQLKTQ